MGRLEVRGRKPLERGFGQQSKIATTTCFLFDVADPIAIAILGWFRMASGFDAACLPAACVNSFPKRQMDLEMSAGRTVGFALLGLTLGAAIGGVLGLAGGLAYTELANISGLEGHSGFVVAYWILGGIIAGFVVGVVASLKWSRR
jgi:hypothetical protein